MNINDLIEFKVPGMVLRLQAKAGGPLTAMALVNRLVGDQLIPLGDGPELEVEVDAAKARIWIEGWHFQRTDKEAVGADEESGFLAGYHRPEYPDIDENMQDATRWERCPGLYPLMYPGMSHCCLLYTSPSPRD